MRKIFLLLTIILVFAGCTTTQSPTVDDTVIVTNFEECIAAGNPTIESYPRQCRSGDQTFTEVIDDVNCENLCGDGICQEIVCMGTGCPCAETELTCPDDCAITVNTNSTELANPASVYCEKQGGTLEMREEDAGTYGVCLFTDGSECDEWNYFRGECQPGDSLSNEDTCITLETLQANYTNKCLVAYEGNGNVYDLISSKKWTTDGHTTTTGIKCGKVYTDADFTSHPATNLARNPEWLVGKLCP